MTTRLLLLQYDRPFARRLAADLIGESMVQCQLRDLAIAACEQQSDSLPACEAVIVDWPAECPDRFQLLACWQQQLPDLPLLVITDTSDSAEVDRLVRQGVAEVCLRSEIDAEYLLLRLQLILQRTMAADPVESVHSVQCQPKALSAVGAECRQPWGSDEQPAGVLPEELPEPLRVLHVLARRRCCSTLDRLLGQAFVGQLDVASVTDFSAAAARCEQAPWDLLLLDLEKPEIAALYAIESMRLHCPCSVILLVTDLPDARFATLAVQRGADEYLDRAHLSADLLGRAVQQALARRRPSDRCSAGGEGPEPESEGAVYQGGVYRGTERRGRPRYVFTQPLIVVPIQPNLAPSEALSAHGLTRDVAEGSIGFELEAPVALAGDLMLLGLEDGRDDTYRFATVELTRVSQLAGHLQVGARFVEAERELLRDENLVPALDSGTLRYATELPPETLRQWAELGLLSPVLLDRMYVCPRCGALPSFRSACHCCGSIHVARHQLVHHFHCEYVGMISEFQKNGRLTCPKCRANDLKAGEDYEPLHGPYHCLDCNWSGNATELLGHCLKCRWRFPLAQASEEEVIGYRANRLNPRDLLDP
jgi:DNA-binding NarL/FixJ family response regulator